MGLSDSAFGDLHLRSSALSLFQTPRLAVSVDSDAPSRGMSSAQDAQSLLAGRERPLLGAFCKIMAMFMFSLMFASIRWLGPHFPIGEIVFFRSLLGLPEIGRAHVCTPVT